MANDLRKAAEMALEALEDIFGKEKKDVGAINALRQALAHEALDRMVAENQRLGLYDDATPEVTTQVTTEVPCKTHPDAPHGFDRNASHSADRYVCECEGWEPVDWEAVAADQAMTIAMMKIENKKEWVGLTDADIAQAMHGSVEGSNVLPYQFARAIEAKLKGKNVPQP